MILGNGAPPHYVALNMLRSVSQPRVAASNLRLKITGNSTSRPETPSWRH